MNNKIHRYKCETCDSEDLKFDAYVTWNVDKQDYEIALVFPKPVVCEPCGGETSYRTITKEVSIEELETAEQENWADYDPDNFNQGDK